MGKWFSNPKSLGKAIGLSGPPGVGKTSLVENLAKVSGR
jgi:ATP-dependent Lon protease